MVHTSVQTQTAPLKSVLFTVCKLYLNNLLFLNVCMVGGLKARVHHQGNRECALLTVAKTWKQPERPSMDREIKKICLHTYTHTSPRREDYYLGINKKGILSFATTCVDPGGTMLSERGQTKTNTA